MEPDPLASAQRRVESYLDQILAPLTRRLSPFHQDELRRELRDHLWARVDAYRELGMAEDGAVTEALHQFGGAKDFLRQWRREWMKTPRRLTLREAWDAGRAALKPSLAGITGGILPLIVLHVCYLNLRGSAASALLDGCGNTPGWAWVWFAFLLLPTLVGMRHGRRTPQRAGVGMVAALTAGIIGISLLYEAAGWIVPEFWSSSVGVFVQNDSSALFAMMAVWIPVASSAAAITGRWRHQSKAHRLA